MIFSFSGLTEQMRPTRARFDMEDQQAHVTILRQAYPNSRTILRGINWPRRETGDMRWTISRTTLGPRA